MFGTAGNENVEGFMGLGFLLAIVGVVGVAAGSGVKQRKAAQPAPIHNHVNISLDMQELQRMIRDEVRIGLESRQSEYVDSGQHPRKVSYVKHSDIYNAA